MGEENGFVGESSNGEAAGLAGEASNSPASSICLCSYADEGSAESQRYYLARRTLLEMLRDRGYAVPASEINRSLQEFRATHGQDPDVERLRISVVHKSDLSKRIQVVFAGSRIVKVSGIRLIAASLANRESLTGLILVLENHITNQALNALDLFQFKVEMFQITDLLVNITKHVLKPKHHVLTEEEKQSLLKKYSIEEKQLPRLLKKDAIARYYGLERGQVVKVSYSGDITGSYVTYRCVW
ncbi:hypothetical protein SLEP1_g48389 [Rubroshorea leprosula]|uniref:Uncharacterized protein n=1 Tax=Rubroshorea leprosula TaxID=152421 RepID=A0AAV5LTN5_9ROSI|nr:hypothetical protein SLEP1_g48389 [Rubroshorea leprosula]